MSTETVIFPDGGKVIGKEAFDRFKADCLRPATPSERLKAIVAAHRARVVIEHITAKTCREIDTGWIGDGGTRI